MHRQLASAFPDAVWEPADEIMTAIRMVKSPGEIAALRRASKIGCQATEAMLARAETGEHKTLAHELRARLAFAELDPKRAVSEALAALDPTKGASPGSDAYELAANTLLAHRLLWLAELPGSPVDQTALKERLLQAYFHDGLDIGDPDVPPVRLAEC